MYCIFQGGGKHLISYFKPLLHEQIDGLFNMWKSKKETTLLISLLNQEDQKVKMLIEWLFICLF